MADIRDVAAYILREQGEMTTMKLQKLVYYAQAWYLVWNEEPLFESEIQAWVNGPVAPELYRAHRGLYSLRPGMIGGDPDHLSAHERDAIDTILPRYGSKAAHLLSALTHVEGPWRWARDAAGLRPLERGSAVITLASIAEYYDGLTPSVVDEIEEDLADIQDAYTALNDGSARIPHEEVVREFAADLAAHPADE